MILKSIEATLEGRVAISVAPNETIRTACRHLGDHNIGALLVIEGERLVGVLSERDVIRKCICQGRRTDETRVADIMTADPVTIESTASLAEALSLMQAGGFRHLPVLRNGAVAGMLSIRDIPLDYRLMRQRFDDFRAAPAVA